MRRAVFLDRDGVLNVDTHYLHRIADVIWVPGAKEAVALLTRLEYDLFIVTNQSGVARGYYTEEDVQLLHEWMCQQLAGAGGKITAVYYCPFLEGAPVEKYNKKSNWRKPAPGMILQAARDYPVDLSRSFMIGDGVRDIECAHAAGIDGYLFQGGRLDDFVRKILEVRTRHEEL